LLCFPLLCESLRSVSGTMLAIVCLLLCYSSPSFVGYSNKLFLSEIPTKRILPVIIWRS
jgi:hypothetical protein